MKLILNDGKEISLDSVKTIQVHANEKLIVSLAPNENMTSYEKRKTYLLVKEAFSSFLGIDCLVVENNIQSISKMEIIKETNESNRKEEENKIEEKKEEKKENQEVKEKKEEPDEITKYIDKYFQDNFKKLLDNIIKPINEDDNSSQEEKEDINDEKSD